MSARLLRGAMRGWRALGIAIALLLVILVTSEPVKHLTHVGASEPPTWTMFLLLFPSLAVGTSRRDWWLGTVMTGLSLITRMNHAIALGWTFSYVPVASREDAAPIRRVIDRARRDLRAADRAQSLLHRSPLGLPGEHAYEATLPMPPSRWLRVFTDNEAHDQALFHSRHRRLCQLLRTPWRVDDPDRRVA